MILHLDIYNIGLQYQAFKELKCIVSKTYDFDSGRKGAKIGF